MFGMHCRTQVCESHFKTPRMRLFYDDDLCCIFEKLQTDLPSLCAISSVCKPWKKVVQPFLSQAKFEHLNQLKRKLAGCIYNSHYWITSSSDFRLSTKYNWESGGCIAFCHSTITTSGTYSEETYKFLDNCESHYLCFEPSSVSLVSMPFILCLRDFPLFQSLEEEITFKGGSREIKIEGKWTNEFVTVTCNGYCPLGCHIEKGDEYKNVRSHINWTNADILFN